MIDLWKQKKRINTALNEDAKFLGKSVVAMQEEEHKEFLEVLDRTIKNFERQIHQMICADVNLKEKYKIILSVYGVGPVTATEILITTQGFTKFETASQYACYAGVAPFQHQSGKFKGKDKVSPMANKRVKKLLHMCAVAAIKHPGELRSYYERKIEEGKHKMSVLNAVRNKIVQRIFSCVNKGVKYEKNYEHQLAS